MKYVINSLTTSAVFAPRLLNSCNAVRANFFLFESQVEGEPLAMLSSEIEVFKTFFTQLLSNDSWLKSNIIAYKNNKNILLGGLIILKWSSRHNLA